MHFHLRESACRNPERSRQPETLNAQTFRTTVAVADLEGDTVLVLMPFGLGFELVFVLPPILWLRRRMRRR